MLHGVCCLSLLQFCLPRCGNITSTMVWPFASPLRAKNNTNTYNPAFWPTIVVKIYSLFRLCLSSLLRMILKCSFSGTRFYHLLRQRLRETNNHTGSSQLALALHFVWGRAAFQYLKIRVLLSILNYRQ
jgi:hypothetical protein